VEVAAFAGRLANIGYVKELVTYETRLFVQKEIDILFGHAMRCLKIFET
jgi:hypothetical protein